MVSDCRLHCSETKHNYIVLLLLQLHLESFSSGGAKRDKITHDIAECELFTVSVLFIQLLYNLSLNSGVCLKIALITFGLLYKGS